MVRKATDTKTKLVCTMGPATRDPELLRGLIREGMDVARINFSHGTPEEHADMIRLVRRIAEAEGAIIGVMADLQGPKLRLGTFDPPATLSRGEYVCLTSLPSDGSHHVFPFPHAEVISQAESGQRLLVDDGAVELVIREARPECLICQVERGGIVSSNKGVAVPDGIVARSALTEKDKQDAAFAVEQGVDFLALSFVRSSSDVAALRHLLVQHNEAAAAIAIVAKIECRLALEAFDEILSEADAIMVARGDLGVEISPQKVPLHQKEIIRKCNQNGVPVITATQMLQSMVDAARPTRAEASDVANAILDGTDAVMLSAETAIGRFPLEAVRVIREISAEIEQHMLAGESRGGGRGRHPVTDVIGDATVQIAAKLNTQLIATATWSGYTARQIARKRPRQPILAFTAQPIIQRQLALVWGVSPVLLPTLVSTEDLLEAVSDKLLSLGHAEPGDWMVLTGGVPIGGGGKTNYVRVHQLQRSSPDSFTTSGS